MLTLQNFDKEMTGAILQRGREYFNDGNVVQLDETGDNTWAAEVEGSETYEVEVTLKNNSEIDDSSCNCPYDGSICKHQVATFFALREELKNKPKQKAKAAAKNVFDKLMAATTIEELRQFVKTQAAKNQKFKTEFELYFADKDDRVDVEAKYKGLLQKIIRNHTDRGYIDYRSSINLARDVDRLLHNGTDYLSKSNFREAFTLARVVLQQMMEVLTGADDSSGSLGGTVAEAINLLQKITEAAPTDMQEQVFHFLQTELVNKIYFEYGDYGYDLFHVYQTLAVGLRRDKEFMSFIDRLTASLRDKYDDYERDFFQKQKIEFLQQTGQTAAAEKLVQQNLSIVAVRQEEVEKAIAKKNFERAKQLIADGIRIAEKQSHPGTVSRWKEDLLRIAEKEKDKSAIRELSMYFAFDRGFSAEPFRKWKKTFTTDEWPEVIEAHIAAVARRITQDKRNGSNPQSMAQSLLYALGPLFIEEKYFDRLLQLVQQANNLDIMLRYHPYLAKQYPTEMLALYLPKLEAYGLQTSDRSGYTDLVTKMQLVIKDIPQGREEMLAIARRLREQFSVKPRRPAMLEELDKLLK